LKSSGINLEDPHLTQADRVQKLFALVIIAFTWAYIVFIALDKLIPINIKKHGIRAKSLIRYGLDYITNIPFCNDSIKFKECCIFFIYLGIKQGLGLPFACT